jgi:large subunit ribosomal protein L5
MLDTANYTPRLKTLFRDTIKPAMKEEFGYKNDMMIPRLEKIVLNIGCGAEASGTARRPSRPLRT